VNRLLSLSFMGFLFVVGCGPGGPKMSPVTGNVTLDGKPIAKAMVTFTPEKGGQSSTGLTDEKGSYVLIGNGSGSRKGAIHGQHKVTIKQISDKPPVQQNTEMSSDSEAYAQQGDPSQYTKAAVSHKDVIPARYNTNSELMREVGDGENVFDFELTSK
jgi:hypothetical protein